MTPVLAVLIASALLAPAGPAGAAEGHAFDGVTLRMAPTLGPRMIKPQGGLQSWACPPGLTRSGDACTPIAVPPNARLHSSGRLWVCERGFRKAGAGCEMVAVPENASLDEQGTGWICNYGYVRRGTACARK